MGKELALEWLEAVTADLKTIERTLDDEGLTHMVAFHAQQSIEKCLKALLELRIALSRKSTPSSILYGLIAEVLGRNTARVPGSVRRCTARRSAHPWRLSPRRSISPPPSGCDRN